ncbi:hypothetical protein BBH99_11780 [Chryseobacterium contaminans]|uniref:Uncharacterized protein n=1 Tax=Chryseobacterium contaminans TaxID=1423959 RepID=A0A1M7IP03_9FLAO|nr:hypothetical protein [Chryseobacterium contaminans]OCA76865.1 hypothetical protein BBH99_11780 [Chryseobacterium contaminans]SHM42536.1 hypothetical protein SAMN05444407_11623 [Chryseobacterium contaminans]
MKNNPFLTVILLFCIQVLLVKYLDYTDFGMGEGVSLAFMCFFIPTVSVVLNLFLGESRYKKAFRYFTFFIVIISLLAFVALSYLGALGRAYQH